MLTMLLGVHYGTGRHVLRVGMDDTVEILAVGIWLPTLPLMKLTKSCSGSIDNRCLPVDLHNLPLDYQNLAPFSISGCTDAEQPSI